MSISDMDRMTPKTFFKIARRVAQMTQHSEDNKEKANASNIMSVVRG